MAEPEPEWLQHLSVLRLELGDYLVIRSARKLSPFAIEALHKTVSERLPGHTAIILEDGMDLGVLRKTREEETNHG